MYDLKSDKPLVFISELVMLKLSFLTCYLVARRKAWKETWGFTSTETIKAYQGRGSWGVGIFFLSNTYLLHCHHQNDSALRWAAVSAILMFH